MKSWFTGGIFLVALAASPAKATTYDVNFVGSFFDVFAEITTTGASVGGGGFDVTSITGYDITNTASSSSHISITGLVTNTSQPNPFNNGVYIYDNVYYPLGGPFVDNAGILFTDASGNILNLYSVGPESYYLSAVSPGGSLYNPGDPGILTDSVVTPLPSTWTMLIVGIVGLGFFTYRRKSGSVAVAAA
jgi:hypothetical protein